MAEEEVGLRTTLKDRVKTARGLDEIDRKVTGVGRSAETAGRRAAIGARGFNSLRKAGRLAAIGAGAAFTAAIGAGYGLIRLVRSSFEEAREAQKVGALTRSTIKATGRAAHVSAPQVEQLAGRLSEMAGIDDELIQTGSNLLLTFKNIRNELGRGNKIFDKANKAAVDLGSTPFYNGNIAGAAKTLGKALNDPVKGISALSRAGVQFSPVQIENIKNMVEQNDLLGAQKIILGEVNSQVGGAAKAQRTWGDVASVTWHNLEERLGKGLLPLLDRFNKWFAVKGADQVDHYFDVFENKGLPALKRFTKRALPLAEKVLPSVATALGDVRDVLSEAAPYAADLVGAFKDMPGWARKAIVGGAIAAYVGSKTGLTGGLKAGGGGLLGAVSKAKPLPVYVVNEGFGLGKGKGGIGGTVKGAAAGTAIGTAGAAAAATAAAAVVAGLAGFGIVKLNEKAAPDSPIMGSPPGSAGSGGGLTLPAGSLDFSEDTKSLTFLSDILGQVAAIESGVRSARLTTQLFGGDLAGVGKTKVEPKFGTPGLPESKNSVETYKGLLGDAGKPVTTTIHANTSPASSAVAALGIQIQNTLSSLGGLFGSSGTSTPTAPRVKNPKPPPAPSERSEKLPVPRMGGQPITVVVELDGKVIAESTTSQHRRMLDDQ